jgi:ABC-type hemin transport system substrate-binding protein
MHVENMRTESIEDVRVAMRKLGELTRRPDLSDAALRRLDARLAAVARSATGQRVLLGVSDSGLTVAGKGTFLSELLERIGGANAADELSAGYPTMDREAARAMRVDRVVVLLPNASGERAEQARRMWAEAVGGENKVTVLTQWHLLLSGYHLADTAEAIAGSLGGGK